jgi:tetratricopeptide (TPR) repeat protein
VSSLEYRAQSAARRPVHGTRYAVLGTVILFFSASAIQAQSETGDSLWAEGKLPAARAAYERALHDNPGSVRALYRLAILVSYDNRLDSALALLRDAREVEPADADVRLHEATVLTWAARYEEALIRFDSLITERPEWRDPRFGKAQALAWSGREGEADRQFQALIAADSNDTETLVALARLRMWQGRTRDADFYNTRALKVAPQNSRARELQDQVRALRRPRLEVGLGVSHDSDDNTAWWQTVRTSFLAGPGLRAFAGAGAYEASDPSQDGTRISGEAGVTWDFGLLSLTGALGARKLASDLGRDRTLPTVQLAASYRTTPTTNVGAGFAHYSLDETAFLIGGDRDIDELSVDGDLEFRPNLVLGVSASRAFISDDNSRSSTVGNLSWRFPPRFTVGLYTRGMWYEFKGNGYFSPDEFLLGEVRGSYTHGIRRWEAKVSGGLGLQKSGSFGSTDAEWHVEARLARRWSVINEVALSGGITNSLISSATGAYHFYTAALTVRLGL